jgi:hypothetical protein
MVQQSADDVVDIARYRRSEHENEGEIQTSMTTDNRRKEERSKADPKELKQNFIPLSESAMVDQTKERSILPNLKRKPLLMRCIQQQDTYRLGHSDHEPPYTVPYVRWCERTGVERLPPTRSFTIVDF